MKKYNFEFIDPGEGIWDCQCFISNVNNIKVENIRIGYAGFVKIIINDLIEVFFEGDYKKNSLIELNKDE